MPTSFWLHISDIIDIIKKYRPKSILEIGIGFGKWGILCREYLEVYDKLRWKKNDWKVIIDGIEIYEPYITPPIKYYYNHIFIGDAYDLIDERGYYDLIIMMDVLEHIPKEKGQILLQKILKRCKYFILSIPLGDWTYQFAGDNKNESHISIWKDSELILFPQFISKKIYHINNKEIGVYIYEKK